VIDVTVMLSDLSDVAKVRHYYSESSRFIHEAKEKQTQADSKLKIIEEVGKDIVLISLTPPDIQVKGAKSQWSFKQNWL